jgi:hypothetical protein
MRVKKTPIIEPIITPDLQPFVEKLSKDLRDSAKLLNPKQVRYLVDCYYQIQHYRIATASQTRSQLPKDADAALDAELETENGDRDEGEPRTFPSWLSAQLKMLENQINGALLVYARNQPTGKWLLSVCGIGPVISAGLLAFIDPEKTKAVSSLWRYAGLDPTAEWKSGQKPPWNLRLKTLCAFKIGESFVKTQNRDADFYGKLYAERKKQYQEINERGGYSDRAKEILGKKKFKKNYRGIQAPLWWQITTRTDSRNG